MSELTFYHAIPSRGLVVHWLLEDWRCLYETKLLQMATEEHKADAYRQINPLARVPAIRHGDVVVTETAAIVHYLAEVFADRGLAVLPGEADRGAYLRWTFFAVGSMESAVIWKALDQWTRDAEYQPYAEITAVAETLNDALEGRNFIVGDRFTAADVIVGSSVYWGLYLMPVLPALPELARYWDSLAQRPAWQRVAATLA